MLHKPPSTEHDVLMTITGYTTCRTVCYNLMLISHISYVFRACSYHLVYTDFNCNINDKLLNDGYGDALYIAKIVWRERELHVFMHIIILFPSSGRRLYQSCTTTYIHAWRCQTLC